MRRICRIVIITLGYVAGLAGATMASAFSCSGGSFLSTVGTPNSDLSGFTGPYGEVCVTLIDSTHALVQAGTFSHFQLGGTATLGLRVISTALAFVEGTGG